MRPECGEQNTNGVVWTRGAIMVNAGSSSAAIDALSLSGMPKALSCLGPSHCVGAQLADTWARALLLPSGGGDVHARRGRRRRLIGKSADVHAPFTEFAADSGSTM